MVIPAWICKHMHDLVFDEIIYSLRNIHGYDWSLWIDK